MCGSLRLAPVMMPIDPIPYLILRLLATCTNHLILCSTWVRPAEVRYTRPCYPRFGELLLQYLIYVQYRFDWLHDNELCITGGITGADTRGDRAKGAVLSPPPSAQKYRLFKYKNGP